MASRTDQDEVFELDEELETSFTVITKQEKAGSSAKFHETEGQSQELLIANFERLIHHLNSRLEERKEIESLKKTLFENQLIEKEREMKNLQKEASAELETHKKEIQTLKSENEKLTTALASCKDAIIELMTEKEEEIKKLQNGIKIEKTRTTSVEEMLTSATAENYDLKCTKTELEEKVKEAEQSIKLQQSENYALQQQIAEKQIQYDELRREKLENEQLAELDFKTLKNLLDDSHRNLSEADLQSNLSKNSTSLRIQDRTINYLSPGTFNNLSSLTVLNFSWCGLTFLQKGVFNNLTNLITLRLNHNYLTCLEGNVFAGLKQLKEIYLQKNNITKFPPQLFRGLESLEEIGLSGNKISVFDEDLLLGLNQLTKFGADNNNLTSIPEKLFGDCVKLVRVYLFNNKIVRLKKTIFDSLHNLKWLDLHDNPLNEMDKNELRMLTIEDLQI